MGVATSEGQAKRLCASTGDAYMQVQSDVCVREDVDTTPLCKYRLPDGTFEPAWLLCRAGRSAPGGPACGGVSL